MTVKLTKPIEDYFRAANAHDSALLDECFTEDAVVLDEGHEYHGLEEIKAWNEETSKRYALTLEVLSAKEEEHQTFVAALASGNFEGSPAAIDFRFTVEQQKITCLHCG